MRRGLIHPPPLHMMPGGNPSYILQIVSGRTEGRDVYGVIGCVPRIVVFSVGTQLARGLVMTGRSNAGAGGGWYLYCSKFVRVKVG